MPKFCGINKRITSNLENNGVKVKRRRFGIDSGGSQVAYDAFGEPVDIDGDIYNDITFYATVNKKKLQDSNDSSVGGRNDMDSTKHVLDLLVATATDAVENDTIEYPIDSGDWYRISRVEFMSGNRMKGLICYNEARNTK